MMKRFRIMGPNVSLEGSATEGCVVLTVIQGRDDYRRLDYETKEHDSFTDAVKYLSDESLIKSGDWERVYILNIGAVEEAEHGKAPTGG